jgi:hypothetical protein
MQVGPGRHTITGPREAAHGTPTLPGTTPGRRPALVLRHAATTT